MAKHADPAPFDYLTALPMLGGLVTVRQRRVDRRLPRPAHGGTMTTGRDIPKPEPLKKTPAPVSAAEQVRAYLTTTPRGYWAEGFRA